MEPLRAENKTSAAAYKSIQLANKNGGTLSIDKADWKKARAKVKAGNYHAALNKLENAVQTKESKPKNPEKINEIWDQIDRLIQ